MKKSFSLIVRKWTSSSLILAAGLLSCVVIAPQILATEYSAVARKGVDGLQAAPKKAKKNDAQEPKKEDEKSTTEKLQEGLETAKEAYEKVGSEIVNGNYANALDGATDMAKDKMIEKAEDALKKKNENLYKAYKLGKDIKDDALKGDYAAVWKKTKDAAYDEAKGYVEDKVIEKIIPGYGQLKGAWDTGYAAGELIGQIPMSADGRTINNLAEDQMRDSFFGKQDSATSKQEAYNEVISALVKSVKNGEYKLPEYMTFSDAREIIQENMDGNRPAFEGFKAWAANELRDEDVTTSVALQPSGQITIESAIETLPVNEPTSIPTETDEDPWAAASIQRKPIEEEEFQLPTTGDEEDIWADDGADYENSLVAEERYQLQQRLEAEKSRARAIADSENYRQFAAAEAEREEKARIKAEKAAEFRAGMNALAQGLGQVAQQIQQAQQGAVIPQSTSKSSSGKRNLSSAEKAAALYQACVQRTGDKKGCRSLSGAGVKLDSDLSQGKIPMDFIERTCRQDADSEKNYKRCVSDRVAEMKQRMNK